MSHKPIKNVMEMVVKAEVSGQHHESEEDPSRCWCLLCRSDILALSLTNLPPRYCTDYSYGVSQGRGLVQAAHLAVSRSMARVAGRPKHRPGRPVLDPARVELVNIPMNESLRALSEAFDRHPTTCRCELCSLDVLAVALNRFPPLYGVIWDGRSSYPPHQLEFLRHDLSQALEQAVKVVASNPHH